MSLQQQTLPPAPPSSMVYQPSYAAAHNGRGSIGPVIAVLAVIAILGIIAGVVGRLCSGRRIAGLGQYDVEGWIGRKCASCIDGRIEHQPPPQLPADSGPRGSGNGGGSASGVAEVKHSPPDPPESTRP